MPSQDQMGERDPRPAADDIRQQLLAGLPVTDRRLQLAGVPTAVVQGGDGPPMILLHGASEVGEGPLESDRVLAWLGELVERTCPSPPILVGHGLGGAIAARLASDGGDRVGRLVLVDTFGLCPYEPAPAFGLALHQFLQQLTEATRDGVFRQCFADLDGLRRQVGERWELLATYVLERARTPGMTAALGSLMPPAAFLRALHHARELSAATEGP